MVDWIHEPYCRSIEWDRIAGWSVCYKASRITACPSMRSWVHCKSDKGIRGDNECVGWYRSSWWSRIDPPRRSVTWHQLFWTFSASTHLSVLWLTNSANVHAVGRAFQATMATFGAVPHHVFHRDESLEACWGCMTSRSPPAPVTDPQRRLTVV